jgi:hypothetical protein
MSGQSQTAAIDGSVMNSKLTLAAPHCRNLFCSSFSDVEVQTLARFFCEHGQWLLHLTGVCSAQGMVG